MLHAVSKKWHLIIMIMVLVLVTPPLPTACGGDDDEEDNAGVVSETGSEKPVEKEYRIGQLTTNFGTSDDMDRSPSIAAEEINEAGGIKIGNTT